jgi:PKD repeat protein
MVEMISNGIEGVVPATFEIEADITAGTEPYTISWDFGGGEGGGESDEEAVLLTFNQAGSYNIAVTVTDSTGQTASDIIVERPSTEESPIVEEPLAEEMEETADFETDSNSGSDGSVELGGLIDNLIDGIIKSDSP